MDVSGYTLGNSVGRECFDYFMGRERLELGPGQGEVMENKDSQLPRDVSSGTITIR
jgi:hypothetical protein